MAGLMLTPEMQAQYGLNPDGTPATGVGSVTQPAIPNPTPAPTATGKAASQIGPRTADAFGRVATGKGAASGKGPQPGPGTPAPVGEPAIPMGSQFQFKQDPMASRGVQSMGMAQPFYMANVADLAQPQMAGQASYMRQMAGLGQAPMAQAPNVSPMPPAQFPPMPPPQTFGGQPPAATGKGPGPGGAPSTGKLPQSQSPTPVAGTSPPTAGGKMPSSGGAGYTPPQTPETETYRPAVQPPMQETSVTEPMTGAGGGGMAMDQGPVMEKQTGGSTYGFDSGEVQNAQDEMIRRAIDAAAGVGPKS